METKIVSKEEQWRTYRVCRSATEEEVHPRRRLGVLDGSSGWATRWTAPAAVEIELEVLDCPICYRPLKPPVFQCAVGHVVCSCCRAKLAGRSCHLCGGAATGFSRCFAVEHIVESVRVPCANAGRRCPAKTPYHGKEEHEETCLYAHAEVIKAVTTDPAAADAPDVPEQQGGNRGSRGVPERGGNRGSIRSRNLVAGLVLAVAGIGILPVAIPVCVASSKIQLRSRLSVASSNI